MQELFLYNKTFRDLKDSPTTLHRQSLPRTILPPPPPPCNSFGNAERPVASAGLVRPEPVAAEAKDLSPHKVIKFSNDIPFTLLPLPPTPPFSPISFNLYSTLRRLHDAPLQRRAACDGAMSGCTFQDVKTFSVISFSFVTTVISQHTHTPPIPLLRACVCLCTCVCLCVCMNVTVETSWDSTGSRAR